jgi:stalled ribosome alternative rescue factor ArfA
MRFMQRGRTAPPTTFNSNNNANQEADAPMEVDTAAARSTGTSTMIDDVNDDKNVPQQPDDVAMMSIMATTTNEDSPGAAPVMATPAEMYGIEGAIVIGRRSFGGFNAVVAENWFRQKQEIFPKKKKNSNGGGSQSRQEDQQILRQFDQLERDEKKTQQGTKKKRNKGISNGNKKRTKTLDDILAMASP